MAQDVLFIDQTLREAASLGPAAVRAILKEMKHLQISLLDVPMALNKSLPLRTQPEFFRAVLPLEQGAATEAAQQGFRQVLFSCSLQQGLPAHTVEVLHEAKMQKLRATLLVEDASLASDLLWQAVLPMLCAAGLEGLAFKDSSAILQPLRLQEHLDLLQQQWPQLTLEFHASNQKQLATANVWAPWQAGVRRPDRAEALKRTHEAAAYDSWFRAQVQAAQDDPRPSLAHEDVAAEFAARRSALRQRMAQGRA